MHQLVAHLDEHAFQRIRKDAEIRGIGISEWVTQAFNTYLHHGGPIRQEVYLKEGSSPSCPAPPLHVEIIHPHGGQVTEERINELLEENSRLREERDQLAHMLSQCRKQGEFTETALELIRLSGEIEKNSLVLDEMESALERNRLELNRHSLGVENLEKVHRLEGEIKRQEYEIEKFRDELEMLLSKRDELRKIMEKETG
jgi:hypothetical protein